MWNGTRRATGIMLALLVPMTASGAAEATVVSPAELHERLVAESKLRQERIARLKNFFSSEAARRALAATRLQPAQIMQAVASLSDDELAQLTARADRAQTDFAAGSLTNEQLTYIVIALGTAVLILVILAAD